MEDIYPEIALKQPKADPRTVLLHKRNFIECSSDHIQDFYRNSKHNSTTTTANCDKTNNMFKYNTAATTTNAHKCFTTALETKTSLESVSASSISSTLSSSLSSSSLLLTTTLTSSSSSTSPSLLSTNLVNFLKSCHLNASLINNYLYKTQKTKLIFFLLFIWCAILIQTTQALPARLVATSGRKLILHTNVYREHYHQKLLEEQRQHNQHQQQKQQLQLQRQQTSLPQPSSIHYLQQQQQQVQNNHIFSPSQTLRRNPHTQPHHRHHLNQRAAPVTSSHHQLQQYKMSSCNGNNIYHNLHKQMNASMEYIKRLCASYLRERGNETFEGMSETWKLISLETRNPNRKPVLIENDLHKEIHEFYLNLHNFNQLIDFAYEDTNKNRTKIEHGEEITIDKIVKFFQLVKTEIKFNMKETDNLLDILAIEKPDLANNKVEFNYNMGRRVRDFLIIKNLIEEFEHILQLVQKYCETNDSDE